MLRKDTWLGDAGTYATGYPISTAAIGIVVSWERVLGNVFDNGADSAFARSSFKDCRIDITSTGGAPSCAY